MQSMLEYDIDLISGHVKVYIERKKIKNFYIKISPDCQVTVSMPLNMNVDKIHDFINTHKKWLEKNLKKFQEAQALNIKDNLSNGGTVKILDTAYLVFIYESKEDKIVMEAGNLYIYSKKSQNLKYVQKQYDDFLKNMSEIYFKTIIDKYYPIISKYNTDRPTLNVKKMKSKWGSCIPRKKQITLNLHLFKAPENCIEYVVLHELAHLLYPGHNKNFYTFLEKQMPNYRIIEKKLDYEIAHLLFQ